MNETNEKLQLIDLGNAIAETRQVSPTPPFFVDDVYGFGSRPNPEDEG